MADLNLEKHLAGLSAEARLRVENALEEALAKEGAGLRAAFDRGPFDRSGYDRSSAKADLLKEVEQEFVEKGPVIAEKGARAR